MILVAAPPEKAPPLQPGFIRGMSFAHVHSREHGYGSKRSNEELQKLKSVGVDWISISPFAYQRAVDAPDLYFGEGDPTLGERALSRAIEAAHALGIQVLLKPHVWSGQFSRGGKWHGDIAMTNPEDNDRWWARYGAYILQNARLAERAHADGLCIGLEYVRMTVPAETPRWRALILAVKKEYHGPLTYGAHHGAELEQIEFWDALDAIGVNAYFPLGTGLDRATAEEIARAWRGPLARLEKLAAVKKKPIVFTEIGFASHAGALERPWSSDRALPEDQDLQARAYEGTLLALSGAPFVKGVFWWKWFSGGPDNPHERDPFDPSAKKAEAVLRAWFRGAP